MLNGVELQTMFLPFLKIEMKKSGNAKLKGKSGIYMTQSLIHLVGRDPRQLTMTGYSGDIVPLIPGILCHRKQM
jgi:hypothetical protein